METKRTNGEFYKTRFMQLLSKAESKAHLSFYDFSINIPNIRALQKDFNEDYDLHTFLVSMSKVMLCIEAMMDGKYFK